MGGQIRGKGKFHWSSYARKSKNSSPISRVSRFRCQFVGDLKRERSAEHKSRCVALYCIFKGYCDELPSCRGQTSNTPPKRELNGSESIGRPVLRSARSGRGVERASREFASEEKSRPPPRKQRRMATRLYVQIVCSGSLFFFSSRVKGKA